MGQFFIQTQEDNTADIKYYELTVTESIKLTYTSTPTKNPVEDGSNKTDHVVTENIKASFTGLVSDIKNISLGSISARNSNQDSVIISQGQRSVEANLTELKDLWKSNKPFTLYYDERLEPLDNCVFTLMDYNRDKNTGTGYKVTMNFEQIQLSERALLLVDSRFAEDVEDQAESKKNTSNNSTEKVGTESITFVGDFSSDESVEQAKKNILKTREGN